ncbi:MAG: methyltransferase domain-containing protein [Deltaproteobacteria bacterium]|nr:methyltransferase domain-containing protein [Deltaproteobacteria bacterium]
MLPIGLLAALRYFGPRWTAAQVLGRIPTVRCFGLLFRELCGACGLEVGGPSELFERGSAVPVYPILSRLDGCNFSTATMWEGEIRAGEGYRFDRRRRVGRQHICEGADLAGIADASYDGVLSCHALEHMANPLRALTRWKQVVRPGGGLLLVVPDPGGCFDHRRPVTTLAHLREDLDRGVGEDDLTHLEEWLDLIDLEMAGLAGKRAELRARSERNAENRGMHHHVFDAALVDAVLALVGWQRLALEPLAPLHIMGFARNPGANRDPA